MLSAGPIGRVVVKRSVRTGLGGRTVARWSWKALWFGEELLRGLVRGGTGSGERVARRPSGPGVGAGVSWARRGLGPVGKERHRLPESSSRGPGEDRPGVTHVNPHPAESH